MRSFLAITLLLNLVLTCCSQQAFAQTIYQTEVLVVGGGASGVAAGIQSARMGVKTLVAEPGPWLGGMITAAGVSAFDGNHDLPSGIWAEFRDQLYRRYGGPGKVATGWVSNTQFEPHVGDSIFKAMVAALPNLSVRFGWQFEKTLTTGNHTTGALFIELATGKKITVQAKQTIDATEMGDVMASAKVPYDLGMEASTLTGEKVGVPATNDIVQDLTYTAILKNYGVGKDCTMVRPAGYVPEEFDGACTNYYNNKSRRAPTVDAQKMLDYGKLPNGKYMVNWPGYGNDIYLNIVEMGAVERQAALEQAKQQTLRFVYFIQHQLGFKHLALADDEFPTPDRLPLMPYIREGRRVKGLVRFNLNHIAAPFEQAEALYRTGIAVGDYPIDHHHRKNPSAPQHLDFYPVPSFNVPLGSLVPMAHQGLVVAEKGISVSNVVNGTTRLQPIVMMIGQAAGALAALAVQEKTTAAQVPVRKVQTALLQHGAYLMPYFDVKKSHPHFQAVQRIGATGIIRGKGIPYKWANQTWFYPDSLVTALAFASGTKDFGAPQLSLSGSFLTQGEALQHCALWLSKPSAELAQQLLKDWPSWGFGPWQANANITRVQWAKLLDHFVHPFERYPVNHLGSITAPYRVSGDRPVRGTWITNVASDALRSPEKIKETIGHCVRNGLTDVFVVVWNNGVTMYPSAVVEKEIGIRQSDLYKGFDPLATIVAEGHKAGLRVHAWFEFGFAYAHKDSTNKGWLAKHPDWVGRNNRGHLLQKNGFYWWSALRPDVQDFMTRLVLEVVNNYAVDGIQGDDRLPAMPSEGGYDDYSVGQYRLEHRGDNPPPNAKDPAFVQWKANRLSQFGKNLYAAVKKARPQCMVTWAPSIYPWSKEQYLQDWPEWLKGGYADWVLPQLYRYDLKAYEKILVELADQVPAKDRYKVFPGILTALGDGYRVKPELLQGMIALNRQHGFEGEVSFYYEFIRESSLPFYPNP